MRLQAKDQTQTVVDILEEPAANASGVLGEEIHIEWLAGAIEHIGSTAAPGLAAKPVIDIMAGVQALKSSRAAISAATELGYCYAPYQAELEHWFCKPTPAFRTHHLHLIAVGSTQWRRPIAFRDYLRAHADVAVEYEALKRRLALEHRLDREAMTNARRPLIERITDMAVDWGNESTRQAIPQVLAVRRPSGHSSTGSAVIAVAGRR